MKERNKKCRKKEMERKRKENRRNHPIIHKVEEYIMRWEGKACYVCIQAKVPGREIFQSEATYMVVWSWRMNWTRCLKGGWRPSVLEGSCKDLPMIYRRVAALRVTLWVAKLLVTITAFGGGDGGARVSAEGFPWRGLLTHSGSVGHRFFCESTSDSLRLDGCRRYSCTSTVV